MLHHVLVLSDDLEASRAFYCEVLGFAAVESHELPFRGVWLAHEGELCVHLADRATYTAFFETLGLAAASGPVDHVAFRCGDLESAAARLEAAEVDAFANVVPGVRRQLYVTDPNGLRIELNVPDE
jgi:catechol 2,3-dioxygenase-like lactoylglutathione lyase family enzyme